MDSIALGLVMMKFDFIDCVGASDKRAQIENDHLPLEIFTVDPKRSPRRLTACTERTGPTPLLPAAGGRYTPVHGKYAEGRTYR